MLATNWRARRFAYADPFCYQNTACIQIDGITYLAVHGNVIAKKQDSQIHITDDGRPSMLVRNRLAEIIDFTKFPFEIRFTRNPEKITLTYKYPKDNIPPVKERQKHEIGYAWTNLNQLKEEIEDNLKIKSENDKKLSNTLIEALNNQ